MQRELANGGHPTEIDFTSMQRRTDGRWRKSWIQWQKSWKREKVFARKEPEEKRDFGASTKSEKTYIVFEGGTDAHTAHNSLRELHGQCRWLLRELSLNLLVAAVSSLEFFFRKKSCLHASKILQQHSETPQIQQQFRQQFRSLLTTATAFVLPNRRTEKSQSRACCNWPSSCNFRQFHPVSSTFIHFHLRPQP